METEVVEVANVPGHRHPLCLIRLEKDDVKCKMCEREIVSSLMFSCRKCKFFICRSCAQLPQRFNHPFHPHHTVVLCHKSILSCNVCALLEPGYGYECSQCNFSLHFKCSSLKLTSNNKYLSVKSDHIHPLIVCDNPYGYIHKCVYCKVSIEEEVYLCLECPCTLDQWCALLPREMTHPFHLQHSLKLHQRAPFGFSRCSICAMSSFDRYTSVYSCSSCNFTIDVQCAALFPATKDSEPDRIQPKTHPHSLITCSANFKNFTSKCYGCGLQFQDCLIYACLQCGILLHKSCADLPHEIPHHPFHPQHSLILFENPTNMIVHSSSYCRSCGDGSGKFVYICRHCDVVLCLKCATAKLHIIMSEIHPHPLAYFDIDIRKSACHFCHSRGNKYFFRCVNCNFNVHDHCFPSLPQTIKHDCHCDPLTFTTTQIKNIPDDEEDKEKELYCNACEQRRNQADPCYFCSECQFVAHVHCVISEILPHLEKDLEALTNKDEASSSSSVEKVQESEIGLQELEEEITSLEKEIDEMAKELKGLYKTRTERVSTMIPIVKNVIRISGNSKEASELLEYEEYRDRMFGVA